MEKLRLDVATVIVENGATQGRYTHKHTLNSQFKYVVGVALLTNNNGGDANFKTNITDNNGVVVDMVNHKIMATSDQVAQREKFMPIMFEADGKTIEINTQVHTALSSELEYQMVFLLSNDKLDCNA